MITKIVSGGQTGVDRAALDIALEFQIDCGGWCPRGRLAEDGRLDARYRLQETPQKRYAQRTEWNVRDSDGTLILTAGPVTGGTALTKSFAERMAKPCLVIDLRDNAGVDRASIWVREHSVGLLNVAGPRASSQQGIYKAAAAFLRQLLQDAGTDSR